MAGYVYKGNQPEPKPALGPKPGPYNPELCGTNQGLWRHRYLKETNCDKCREHQNERRRASHHETKDQPRKHMRLATIEKLQQAEKLFAAGASQNQVHKKTGLGRMTLAQYFPGQGWTKAQAGTHSAQQRTAAQRHQHNEGGSEHGPRARKNTDRDLAG